MSTDLLHELEARYQIEEVLRRYCRGVDRGDAELIRSVYHEDALDGHGRFKGRGVEFADYVVESMRERMLATMHNLHQINLRFDGETAWAESYFTAHHRRVEGEDTILDSFGGRYVDRLERREGEWKIANRVVVHDWSKVEKVDREFPTDFFEQGKRSTDDLSYRDI